MVYLWEMKYGKDKWQGIEPCFVVFGKQIPGDRKRESKVVDMYVNRELYFWVAVIGWIFIFFFIRDYIDYMWEIICGIVLLFVFSRWVLYVFLFILGFWFWILFVNTTVYIYIWLFVKCKTLVIQINVNGTVHISASGAKRKV